MVNIPQLLMNESHTKCVDIRQKTNDNKYSCIYLVRKEKEKLWDIEKVELWSSEEQIRKFLNG